jgi:hypothetical protein
MLKFIQKLLHNNFLKKYGFGFDYIGIFFYISEYFRQMTVLVCITLFSKLINVTKVTGWECSNQYKVNTYHYINYQDHVCTQAVDVQWIKCRVNVGKKIVSLLYIFFPTLTLHFIHWRSSACGVYLLPVFLTHICVL